MEAQVQSLSLKLQTSKDESIAVEGNIQSLSNDLQTCKENNKRLQQQVKTKLHTPVIIRAYSKLDIDGLSLFLNKKMILSRRRIHKHI